VSAGKGSFDCAKGFVPNPFASLKMTGRRNPGIKTSLAEVRGSHFSRTERARNGAPAFVGGAKSHFSSQRMPVRNGLAATLKICCADGAIGWLGIFRLDVLWILQARIKADLVRAETRRKS
jgi:hypothetical protein